MARHRSEIPPDAARSAMARPPRELPPILYEDEAVLVFDKPSGLPVLPERWDRSAPYLVAMVSERMSSEFSNAHRIDRDTSGCILFAKSKEALRNLMREFRLGHIEKRYLAITAGAPRDDSGLIDKPVSRRPSRPGLMRIDSRGRESQTAFEVLERWRKGYALLSLRPRTGRTHQIRVHLAHVGCPVVGDPLYGDGRGLFLSDLKRGYKRKDSPERPLMGRLALHAESIAFSHPVTAERVAVSSPIPPDFELALKNLRRYAG